MSVGALIEKFRAVALERIERMNLLLVTLERSPDDPASCEELLREIHTLKGEAKMMGFADVNLVAHQTEHLLMAMAAEGFAVPRQMVDVVFEGFDLTRSLLTKSAGAADVPIDLAGFVDRAHAAGRASEDLAGERSEAGVQPGAGLQADASARTDASVADASPADTSVADASRADASRADSHALADETSAIEASEASEASEKSAFERGFSQTRERRTTRTRIQALDGPGGSAAGAGRARSAGSEDPAAAAAGAAHKARDAGSGAYSAVGGGSTGGAGATGASNAGMLRIQTTGSLRVELEKLEALGDVAADVLLMSRRLEYRLRNLEDIRDEFKAWLGQAERNLPKSQQATVRNLIHRLDAFETSMREESYLVNLRSGQLDEQTRRLRHVPLAQVMGHYPRAVRDLASSQGKLVRLVHSFGDVEVERGLLSALSEPLLHLVRNAVDHGIESPDERRARGKEPEGEIGLVAEYVGDGIRVVLSDDGRGIDPAAIRRKAFERGLITDEQARTMSDEEAVALIFEPGFTTRDVVSDVSGRGIGMDIVRRQISRLGGYIEIESEVDRGTSFMLHLPVASAVNAILVVVIAGRRFAMMAKDVERIDVFGHDDLRRTHGRVCVRYDDELVPLVDWATLLEVEREDKLGRELTALLVRKGTRRLAVLVDEVVGEREAISRPLGEFLSGLRLCRGVAVTDAGEVVPLLSALDLIRRTHSDTSAVPESLVGRRRWTALEGLKPLAIKTVLVVEDSEVTRTLVVSILKGLGYRVLEADDGDIGLHLLERHRVDLVLTDVQMPRMSGLEMLREIRASQKHAHLPVVILSTLGDVEDKARAMQFGANGYLVKLDFQEKALVDTVRRYLG